MSQSGNQAARPGQVTMIRLPAVGQQSNIPNRLIVTRQPTPVSPSRIIVQRQPIGQKVVRPIAPVSAPRTQYIRLVSGAGTATQTVISTAESIANRKLALIPSSSQSHIIQTVPYNTQSSLQQATPTQRVILPAATSSQTITFSASANINQIRTQLPQGTTILQTAASVGSSAGQYVAVLPSNVQYKVQSESAPVTPSSSVTQVSAPTASMNQSTSAPAQITPPAPSEMSPDAQTISTNAAKQRKPCNCTKSQCLKLYCDCFANGEFCQNCNCANCANNLENEDQRQKAIKQCLERNPQAFHPKIGKGESAKIRRHQKGCNCKRSGCLKNYCECYEAKIACGSMCKCVGCKNCGDDSERKSLMHLADAAMVRTMQQNAAKSRLSSQFTLGPIDTNDGVRESLKTHLETNVIEAVVGCLVTQCREAELAKCKPDTTEKLIFEEFGRCLTRIINISQNEAP